MINIIFFNKFQFFFEFLQYGEESLNINETNEKRANIFISYLKKFPQEELITSLKNNFLPIFKEVLNKIEPFLNENEIQKSKQFSNEINKILNVKEDASLLKDYNGNIYTLDARKISVDALGKYFPNVPMLAGIVKISGVMTDEELIKDMEGSFKHKFAKKPEVIEGNMNALKASLKEVKKIN